MEHQPAAPEERFAALVAALRDESGVIGPPGDDRSKRRFGSTELKVHGKIFAMLVKDRLVVKLPRARVDALVASGEGERFDPRHDGRLMKEWAMIAPALEEQWLSLAREAMRYVASQASS
jgi:TfoX/Sxy family transcriptional regulator of competence genes